LKAEVGFFVRGPAIFVIVHAYVLLHFVLLADNTRILRQIGTAVYMQGLTGDKPGILRR